MTMKNLLIKEFKLAMHPTMYIFLCFGAMLLIPSYPYYVAFIYTCLAIFFTFLGGRENKDIFFTVSLPIRKRDAVKARCYAIVIVEIVQIIIAIPFAIIGSIINPNLQGNMAGIEANIAFFGFVFIMFALFNTVFLSIFYKTAYKVGLSMVLACTVVVIYIIILEIAVGLIPFLKTYLDTSNPNMIIKQLPILLIGMAIYIISMLVVYKKSAKIFEKVDL